MAWIRVCALQEIPVGGSIAVLHGTRQVAVFRPDQSEVLFATQNHCPHSMQNVLSRGILGDCCGKPKVTCPLHKRAYHLEDGSSLAEGHGQLMTYSSKIEAGSVFLDLPELPPC